MRFKSILGALLFVMMACFIAFIIFIQTKSFGGLVTRIVSDLSEKKLNTQVEIKSFSLSVFPPGLELNKVNIKKNFSEVETLDAEFGKIGFYISLIEVEERKLTLGEIRIVDSSVHYTFPEKNEEINEIDPELIKKIFKISENAPIGIDTVILENARLFANRDLLEAKRFKIFKKGGSFITRFQVANIKPIKDSDFTLDEVWGDAKISKTDIKLYRLKAQHDVHTLLLKGNVADYYKLKNSTINLNGEAMLHLKSLDKEFEFPELIKIKKGVMKAGFNVSYNNSALVANADILIQDLKSNFLYAEKLRTQLSYNGKRLLLEELSLANKKENLTLREPVIVFNAEDKSYLTKPINVSVENVTLRNGLRILGPSFKVLKGELTGKLAFKYQNKNFFFLPEDGFFAQNLGLVVGGSNDPFTILMIKKAIFKNAEFALVNKEFQMNASIKLPQSEIDVTGFVNKDKVQFNAPDAKINLEDFGNISNLDIKGAGELGIFVSGPLDNTMIDIKGRTQGFEVLGYRLDKTEKSISIDLANSEVIIKKMESLLGKTHLTGNGTVNYGNSDIALGISSNDATSSDIFQILHPIFKELTFLPEDLDFKAAIEVDIFGKTRMEDLKLRSKINFSDLVAYEEMFNSGSFNLYLMNQVLNFKNITASKDRGVINGNFTFGMPKKSLKMKFLWDNIALSSLQHAKRTGINMDSTLTGSLIGSGTVDDYLLKLDMKGFNTKTLNHKFQDSTATLDITNKRVFGKMNLLGEMITSDFNLSLKPGLASDLKLKFVSDDMKPFLVALFGQHLEAEEFVSKIHFEGETTFQDGFNKLDLTGNLKKLVFQHPQFRVDYSSIKPDFLVKNSVIQSWNLNIREGDFFVLTKGEGVFGKKVSLVQEVYLNSKILEILFAPILSSEGFMRNIVKINGEGTDFDLSISSRATDLDLSIDQLPIPINDLKYSLDYSKRRLVVQDVSTSLDKGSVSLKGDIYFDDQHPDVNLKFIFDKAEFPILGSSLVNISGEGIILGNNFPYNVGGEIMINKAQIINELNEFSSKSAAFSQVRFLPKNRESVLGKLFNLNLIVKADNPVRVTNSLMDVALKGEARIFGNPSRPRGEGRLFTPPNSSRIFFKNNEYYINTADINFNPKKDLSNPDFDVQAVTYISTYRVFPKAYGDLERFNFDLTSDPPLPRNSILSLIAFGYTDEIQSSLEAKDQQNLTQVGVGSFVFDRFKISDILNKQFGLQVNLGTVIEQSGTDSLLSGRSQEGGFGQGGGSLGRTRSATKIELKKRLDEALTLSVSSTMGGSIGQRQSMNLTYGLTRKIQLEGVYELRTNEEGQEDVIDNSIGGDLKFRWTFK